MRHTTDVIGVTMKINTFSHKLYQLTIGVILLATWPFTAVALSPADVNTATRTIQSEFYDEYTIANSKTAVLCKRPCSISAPLIKNYVLGFESARQEVVRFMGFDVIPQYTEVQFHLSESATCPTITSAAGYARVGYDASAFVKLCLFEETRHATNLANGYQARFTPTVPNIDHYILPLHEYLHGMMFGRMRYSFEWIAFWVSWHVGNPNDARADLCNSAWDWSMTKLGYELCNQLGLGPSEFQQVMRSLEARYQSNEGFLNVGGTYKRKTSLADFRREIDTILGTPSTAVFNEHWSPFVADTGIEFEFGTADFQHSHDGRIELGGLQQPQPSGGHTQFRIDVPTSSGGFITPGFFSNIFAIAPSGQDSRSSETPIAFNGTVDLQLALPASLPASAQTQEWTMIHMLKDANGARWRYVPGTKVTSGGTQIAVSITESGHYAVGPKFAVPAGLYVDAAYPNILFHYRGDDKTVDLTIYKLEPYGAVAQANGASALGNVPYSSEQFSNTRLQEQGRRKGNYWFNRTSIQSNFVYQATNLQQGFEVRATLKGSKLFTDDSVSLTLKPFRAWHKLKKRRLYPRYQFKTAPVTMLLHADSEESLLVIFAIASEQGTRLVVSELKGQQSRSNIKLLNPECGVHCLEEAETVGQVWFNNWWEDGFSAARIEAEIAGEGVYFESELNSNEPTDQ
jgi:hypothetical protein